MEVIIQPHKRPTLGEQAGGTIVQLCTAGVYYLVADPTGADARNDYIPLISLRTGAMEWVPRDTGIIPHPDAKVVI